MVTFIVRLKMKFIKLSINLLKMKKILLIRKYITQNKFTRTPNTIKQF